MTEVSLTGLGFFSDGGRAGDCIPPAISGKLEDFFGADLTSVKLQVGLEPALFDAVGFAYGERVFVRPEFAPDCPGGLGVLVHELTHVLQQRRGMVQAESGSGIAIVNDDHLEAEAQRAAQLFTNGTHRFDWTGGSAAAVGGAPVVQCLTFHGQLPNGKFGTLDANQLQAWVINKSGRAMKPSKALQCVGYLQGHPGAGGGGAFGNYTFGGNQVYHISHGQQGSNQGCTLFFTESNPGIATICGIGYHQDNAGPGGLPRYRLDWVKNHWHNGNYIWP